MILSRSERIKLRDEKVYSSFKKYLENGLNITQATYKVMEEFQISSIQTVQKIRKRMEV